jgi:hypothetical protein
MQLGESVCFNRRKASLPMRFDSQNVEKRRLREFLSESGLLMQYFSHLVHLTYEGGVWLKDFLRKSLFVYE